MKRIFFCLLLLNIQNLKAQDLAWFPGSLVLATGEVLVGETAVKPEHDIILFQHDGLRMVYPAHQIQSLYFYDKLTDINRRYISIAQTQTGVRANYQLYEIILKGEVNVVRRKKESAFSLQADALDYNYFILYNNNLTPLRKFNKKIFPLLIAASDKRLEMFISINRLTARHAANAIRIVEFYNKLASTEESFATNLQY